MKFEKGKFGLSATGECVDCKKKKLKIFEEVQEEEFFEEVVEDIIEEDIIEDDIVDKKAKKKK